MLWSVVFLDKAKGLLSGTLGIATSTDFSCLTTGSAIYTMFPVSSGKTAQGF
jgi:hypothetical protein